MNLWNVILYINYVIAALIGLPATIYSCYILKRDWNALYIIKRHRLFVGIMLFGLSVPIMAQTLGVTIVTSLGSSRQLAATVDRYLLIFVTAPSSFLCGWILVARFWLFYYDSKLLDFENNKEWRMAIDPIKQSDNQNWFIKNLNRFGNAYYLLKVFLFIVLIESIVFALLRIFTNDKINEVIPTTWFATNYAAIFILTFGVLYKIKQEVKMDNLGILKEIYTVCIFGCIMVIAAIILSIFLSQFENDLWTHIVFLTFGNVWCSTFIVIEVPYCKYLFWQYYRSPVQLQIDRLKTMSSGNNNSNNNGKYETEMSSSSKVNDQFNYSWKNIVSVYDGYVAFMNHLGKELSMENLLFIQEYVQIKQVLFDIFESIMNDIVSESRTKLFTVKLAENSKKIPESMIGQQMKDKLSQVVKLNENVNQGGTINNNNNNNDNNKLICVTIMQAFRKLYSKYIDSNGAVFMINISSRNRNTLKNMFDSRSRGVQASKTDTQTMTMVLHSNDNDNDHDGNDSGINNTEIKELIQRILISFEPSVAEIAALMGDSFTRFRIKEKELYNQLCLIVSHGQKSP